MEEKFIVSPSPHIISEDNIQSIMRDVIISLVPALLASVYLFRWFAVKTVAVSIASALVSEIISRRIENHPV